MSSAGTLPVVLSQALGHRPFLPFPGASSVPLQPSGTRSASLFPARVGCSLCASPPLLLPRPPSLDLGVIPWGPKPDTQRDMF